MKYLLIALGTLFIGLAVLGIIIPGLPATPFLLLAAACFVKSSPKLYNWLTNHKTFGPFIRNFAEKKGISKRNKAISISLMWLMILLSLFLFIENDTIKYIVIASGLIGTSAVLLIKTV